MQRAACAGQSAHKPDCCEVLARTLDSLSLLFPRKMAVIWAFCAVLHRSNGLAKLPKHLCDNSIELKGQTAAHFWLLKVEKVKVKNESSQPRYNPRSVADPCSALEVPVNGQGNFDGWAGLLIWWLLQEKDNIYTINTSITKNRHFEPVPKSKDPF